MSGSSMTIDFMVKNRCFAVILDYESRPTIIFSTVMVLEG